jgi:hypothetical protein
LQAITRRQALGSLLTPLLALQDTGTKNLDFQVNLHSIRSGFAQDFPDRRHCWVHARPGVIPGSPPTVVITMQKVDVHTTRSSYDVYYRVSDMRSDDLGAAWSAPLECASLGRRREEADVVATICDFIPQWHARTGRLLGIGHTVFYRGNTILTDYPMAPAYSVYDDAFRTWSSWRVLKLPRIGNFYHACAGCAQRVDLPDGRILLPFYFGGKGEKDYRVTVAVCSFDGQHLRYLHHGAELALEGGRGLAEPSLVRYRNRFYLTLRNDLKGYVSTSQDGSSFDAPKPWVWDDGSDLGNYNTQQHWVSHSDSLFLVYTRRGANNDRIFRHRAPLFMAQVDLEKRCLIRKTERILVPERGADIGNFGVSNITPAETWVTTAEWMRSQPSDNNVFVARILWNRPNHLVSARGEPMQA